MEQTPIKKAKGPLAKKTNKTPPKNPVKVVTTKKSQDNKTTQATKKIKQKSSI